MTTIKEYAFNECRSLTGIHLPRNLRQISYNAFRYANALTYIEIPDLCEDIGNEAFLYDSKISKLILPGSLTTLGADAFWSALNYDYTDLYTFSPTLFTDGVTDAFHFQISYPERQNVTLHVPRTLLAQYQAANEWSWAKSIVACDTVFADGFRHRLNCADKQLTIIKHYLSKDDDTLEVPSSIDLPVGADAAEAYAVTGIGDDVFANTASLRVAKLGDVEVIGARAFQSCHNLQSFEGEKIREVGASAFDSCSALHAIILPASVETVRANAFKWCGNITTVTVKVVEPPAAENLFSSSIYSSAKLYVPSESVGAYAAHAEWGRFTEILPIPTYSLGDINQDGNIDGSDVSALLEMVLSGGVTDEQVAVADINSDGAVDGSDVSALLEMVLSGS